jgi:putative MATE family efflux protein
MIPRRPSGRAAARFASPTRTTRPEPFTSSMARSLRRDVLAMGIPSMTGFLMLTIYDLVDIFWLARLGEGPVAAVTAFSAWQWILTFGNQIVGTGSVSFISRRFGAGDTEGCERAIQATFLLKAIVGLFAGAVGLLATRLALTTMGAAPEVVDLGVTYGTVRLLAVAPELMSFSVYTALRGIGRPSLGMWISIVGTLINLGLDPLLIFGAGPIPALGILGAAIASAIGFLTVTVWGMVALSSRHSPLRVRWITGPRPTIPEMKSMIRIGAPSGGAALSFSLFSATIVSLVAVHGTTAVALFGMAQKIIRFGRMLVGGLSLGSSALIGQQLGAGRLERAWLTTVVSARLGIGILLTFGGLVAIAAPQIARVFFPDAGTASAGVVYLRLLALGLPFAGITSAAEAAFSGAGLNAPTMIAEILVAWCLTVPLTMLLGQTLGAPGTLLGISCGEVMMAAALFVLLRRGNWLAHSI